MDEEGWSGWGGAGSGAGLGAGSGAWSGFGLPAPSKRLASPDRGPVTTSASAAEDCIFLWFKRGRGAHVVTEVSLHPLGASELLVEEEVSRREREGRPRSGQGPMAGLPPTAPTERLRGELRLDARRRAASQMAHRSREAWKAVFGPAAEDGACVVRQDTATPRPAPTPHPPPPTPQPRSTLTPLLCAGGSSSLGSVPSTSSACRW